MLQLRDPRAPSMGLVNQLTVRVAVSPAMSGEAGSAGCSTEASICGKASTLPFVRSPLFARACRADRGRRDETSTQRELSQNLRFPRDLLSPHRLPRCLYPRRATPD